MIPHGKTAAGWAIVFVCGMILFSGCSVPTFLTLYNHSGVDLTFYTTSRTYQLNNNGYVTLKYPPSVMIKNNDGSRTWEYKIIYPPGKFYHPIFPKSSEYEVFGQIEPSGSIYVVKPNLSLPVRELPPQPSGFPIIPIERQPR